MSLFRCNICHQIDKDKDNCIIHLFSSHSEEFDENVLNIVSMDLLGFLQCDLCEWFSCCHIEDIQDHLIVNHLSEFEENIGNLYEIIQEEDNEGKVEEGDEHEDVQQAGMQDGMEALDDEEEWDEDIEDGRDYVEEMRMRIRGLMETEFGVNCSKF